MSTDLDITFNTPNGFLTTTFNTLASPPELLPQDTGVSVVIRSDNRIVMGGYSIYSTISYISLSCYNTDGSLYTAFGLGGKVLELYPNCIVNEVILQPNDYIIVTGNISSPQPSMFVARFTSLGALDTLFGTGGYVIIVPGDFDSLGNLFDECDSNSVILQPADNYIVLGGRVRRYSPAPNKNFLALVRLDSTGVLDTLFGTNGNGTVYASLNLLNNNQDICNCLSIQTDGKIVSGGINFPIPISTSTNLFVSRFNTDGSLDTTTFNSSGTPGWLIIPNFFTSPNNSLDLSSGLGINSVGQIIISCYTIKQPSTEGCFGLAAVTPSGILDTSFGTGGQTVLDLFPTYNLTGIFFNIGGGNALALQSDNKIVITGGFTNLTTLAEGFSLARFNTNGTLDLTFGVAGLGYILSDLVSPNTETGYSVAIQTDGKVLVGGSAFNNEDSGANHYFILARYFYTPIPTPIVPICFPAGTPVLTDQGNILIEEINPEFHTIHKKPIIAITQSFMNENNIVCIEKHSLGINIPNKRTYISNYHGIVYKNKLIPAKQLVGRLHGVYHVKYNGEILYNVLMEKHYIMNVNNIRVETLNPRNIVAKLYTNEHTPEEKTKIILEINETSKNNINNHNYESYNGYEKITNNLTRRKFSILRCNPLISRLNFHSKKHFVSQNSHNHTIKNKISFTRNNPMVKINTHTFRYGRRRR